MKGYSNFNQAVVNFILVFGYSHKASFHSIALNLWVIKSQQVQLDVTHQVQFSSLEEFFAIDIVLFHVYRNREESMGTTAKLQEIIYN